MQHKYIKHYSDRNSTKKLQSLISIVWFLQKRYTEINEMKNYTDREDWKHWKESRY